MLTELKPCPFCGGTLAMDGSAPGHAENCYIVLRIANRGTDDEFHAAWNRRAASAAPAEGCEGVWPKRLTAEAFEAVSTLIVRGLTREVGPHVVYEAIKEHMTLTTAPTMSEAARRVIDAARRVIGGGVVRDIAGNGTRMFLAGVSDVDSLSVALSEINRAAAKGESDAKS